jgi:hypothetical protein
VEPRPPEPEAETAQSPEAIQALLEEVSDYAVVFHGYADYGRDYEVVFYEVDDPASGVDPFLARCVFKHCVVAEVETTLSPQVWRDSLDDQLIDRRAARDVAGYAWGTRWQRNHPGVTAVYESERTQAWTKRVGIPFSEVGIETDAHRITLVFSELVVIQHPGEYVPYRLVPDPG